MDSPQDGYRRIKTVTSALVALAIAGTLGGSAMAFADTQASSVAKTTPAAVPHPTVSNPAESSPDGSGSTSSGPSGTSSGSGTSGYGYGPAPQLSTGSGRPNAVSSGS